MHVATGNALMGAVQKSNLHRLRMDYESTIKRNLIMLTNDDLRMVIYNVRRVKYRVNN